VKFYFGVKGETLEASEKLSANLEAAVMGMVDRMLA